MFDAPADCQGNSQDRGIGHLAIEPLKEQWPVAHGALPAADHWPLTTWLGPFNDPMARSLHPSILQSVRLNRAVSATTIATVNKARNARSPEIAMIPVFLSNRVLKACTA